MQLDLFDGEEFGVDEAFSTARRTWLDDTSWVEHVPGWLSGSRELLADLIVSAPWEQRERWMYTRMVTEPRLARGPAGRCQRDWRHCVPKQKSPAGPRSSLNFNSRRQA